MSLHQSGINEAAIRLSEGSSPQSDSGQVDSRPFPVALKKPPAYEIIDACDSVSPFELVSLLHTSKSPNADRKSNGKLVWETSAKPTLLPGSRMFLKSIRCSSSNLPR